MRAGRANLRAGRANLRPTGGGDGRKDGRTYGNSPLCSTGHRPFGAAAQKVSNTLVFPVLRLDHYTPTDQHIDKAFYRVLCPQLKRGGRRGNTAIKLQMVGQEQ